MNKNNIFSQIFDNEGAIFMSAQRSYKDCYVGLFGVRYDGTTSFRPGSRFGPSSIKEISTSIESYCPILDRDLEEINFVDFGSLKIPYGDPQPIIQSVEKVSNILISNNIKPLMLGGEHSITTGAIRTLSKIYSNLILIQLDAHADLRNEWLGSKYNHACTMRRCLEIIPSSNVLQIGIRSGTRDEFKELHNSNRFVELKAGEISDSLEKRLEPFLGLPIYLTIDLDWFDPSVMPGTGTPEPGGFYWNDFADITYILKKHHLIGADIVELAPQLDSSGISNVLAAKVTRSMIMLLEGK